MKGIFQSLLQELFFPYKLQSFLLLWSFNSCILDSVKSSSCHLPIGVPILSLSVQYSVFESWLCLLLAVVLERFSCLL